MTTRTFRRRTAVLLAAAVTSSALVAGAVGVPARAATGVATNSADGSLVGDPAARADDGARVVRETVVDAWTVDLTIDSPALGMPGKVRLLLPAGWNAEPAKRWPTLYLLHGANEPKDYTSWTAFTDVGTFLQDKNVLTVLPTSGEDSLFSDPWNYGRGGTPKYETFHLQEVKQLVERGYRGSTTRRAIAGLSVGGLGAFKYAAKYPGVFRAAASYSGLLNTKEPGASAFVTTIRLRAGHDPYALWGQEFFQPDIWAASNPYDLAPRLAGIPLFVSSGNGLPGVFDKPLAADLVIEPAALAGTRSFLRRAGSLGLNVTTDLYGNGTHTWPYWQREFKRSWPVLAQGLGVAG